MMKSKALVISGGGAFGAHPAGICQALFEETPLLHELVEGVGTSTGALIIGLVTRAAATKDMQYVYDMLSIYKNVEDNHILGPADAVANTLGGVKGLVVSAIIQGRAYLYKTDPLEKLIRKHMTDEAWRDIKDSSIRAGFCVVNMETGDSEVFWSHEHDAETLRLAMLASASQPVIMEPVIIGGIQYCDGGLLDFVPTRFLQTEVDEVLVVSTQKTGSDLGKKRYTGVIDTLERVLDIFIRNVYEHNKRANLCAADIYTYFEPYEPLVGDALKFEPEQMRQWVQQGFHDAMRNMGDML